MTGWKEEGEVREKEVKFLDSDSRNKRNKAKQREQTERSDIEPDPEKSVKRQRGDEKKEKILSQS